MTSNLDIAGYASLGDNINKKTTDGSDELKVGVVSEKLPELELPMSDEDIVGILKSENIYNDLEKRSIFLERDIINNRNIIKIYKEEKEIKCWNKLD